jgi:serine/threonine protein kinase
LQIVMEFVASGSLTGFPHRAETLREPVAAMYMRDVLCGLEYLHRSGVRHRDIKSENILVSPEGRCKITDYGASKVLRSSIADVSMMLNAPVLRDRTRKNTAASALNSKPRESFAGSQGVNEDDDGMSLSSRCHACGEELALSPATIATD